MQYSVGKCRSRPYSVRMATKKARAKPNRTEVMTIRVSPDELDALRKAAEADRRLVSDWCRMTLLEAAARAR